MRVWRCDPQVGRRQHRTFFHFDKVYRLSWILTVAAFSSLLLFSLPSLSQTSTDTTGADSTSRVRLRSANEYHAQPSSPYLVSVNHLRAPAKAINHLEAAHNYFFKMQLAQAKQEIDQAIKIYPDFVQAFQMMALLQLAESDFTGSVESAGRAIRINSMDASSWLALATAYNSLNEWTEAEAAVGRALELDPSSWQGRLELAKSFYGQGKYGLSLNTIDQINQDFPDVHLLRANVLVRLSRKTEAIKEFDVFIKQAPDDARCQQIRQIVAEIGS